MRRDTQQFGLPFITWLNKVLFDLFCREGMDKIFGRHIANYSGTSHAENNTGERLQFKNALIASIATFMQFDTGKAFAGVLVVTKMETVERYDTRSRRETTYTRVSITAQPYRLALSSSSSVKDGNIEADRRGPGHHLRSCRRYRRQGQTGNALQHQRNRPN